MREVVVSLTDEVIAHLRRRFRIEAERAADPEEVAATDSLTPAELVASFFSEEGPEFSDKE